MFWLGVGVGRVEEFRVSDEDGGDDGNPRQRARRNLSPRRLSCGLVPLFFLAEASSANTHLPLQRDVAKRQHVL